MTELETHSLYAIVKKDPNIVINTPSGIIFDCDVDEHKYIYIGITNNFEKRMSQHKDNIKNINLKKSLKLYNRLRRYGWEAFDKMILKTDLTLEEAKKEEIYTIALYNTFEQGLNSTPGGDTGPHIFGAEHWSAKPINIYNNNTGEITSFNWIGGAAGHLDIPPKNVAGAIYGLHTSQTYSKKHNSWFQIKYAYDETPFVEDMSTPNEKRAEYNNVPIVVMNIDTKEFQKFDSISKASLFFNINRVNITSVLINKAKQFLVETSRYDAQYDPPTRDWNYDILKPHDMMAVSHWEGVVAYDTDDILVYDFVSFTDAATNTKIAISSIIMSARHQNWYAGKKNNKWLRWEYKDLKKRDTMPPRPVQKKTIIKLYFIDDDGCEHAFTSVADAANDTRGKHSFSTQKKYINKSLNSNGTICCKTNKIWYKK